MKNKKLAEEIWGLQFNPAVFFRALIFNYSFFIIN